MCEAPVRLQDGTVVACRGCQLCHTNRVNDLVGRCIAEQSASSFTVAVTLTYAGDVPESAALYYPHIQQFLKRLRKAGYKVRYIVAGEYGTKKGRAHWHIVLFFNGDHPKVEINRRVEWAFWPHGLCYFQHAEYKGFKYLLKYILKQEGVDGYQKALGMSKKPPLGYDFFMQLASDLVSRHLPLHSPEYAFSHVVDKTGKPRKFWLQGRMREMLLERYVDLYRATHDREPPYTEFVLEKHLDKIAAAEMEADNLEASIDAKRTKLTDEQIRQRNRTEDFLASGQSRFDQGKKSLGYCLLNTEPRGIVEAFSDGTATIFNGVKEWSISQKEIEGPQFSSRNVPLKLWRPVCRWLEIKWQSHDQSINRT